MKPERPRVLVLASRAAFRPLFDALEAEHSFQFDYVTDVSTLPTYLASHAPSAVLLEAEPRAQTAREPLAWLDTLKRETPVVVLASRDDVPFYLAVMERGAFDYFTASTPLRDVTRVLENAIRWHQHQAA